MGPRNLFWRWAQVVGFALMFAAVAVHSVGIFVTGVVLLALGVGFATRTLLRYPERARARARDGRSGWVLFFPVYLVTALGWLLADTRAALRERHAR
jgi:hypothetical protein